MLRITPFTHVTCFIMLKRPRHTETEEDLLSLQESFFSSKEQCSTKISKRESQEASRNPPEKRNIISLPSSIPADISNHESMEFHQDIPGVVDVLQPVKDRVQQDPMEPVIPAPPPGYGFPKPQKLSHFAKRGGGRKGGKSLFAQQFDSQNVSLSTPEAMEGEGGERDKIEPLVAQVKERLFISDKTIVDTNSHAFAQSRLISGDGLRDVGATPLEVEKELSSIHTENTQRLVAMTEQELIEEKGKMEKLLGPQLVAFLQSRAKTKLTKAPPPVVPVPQTSLSSLGTSSDQSKWLHMNVEEKEKTRWMEDVKIDPSKMPEFYRETRFSLNGLIIPRDVGVAISSDKALHHHGDEPECAGYTLGELSRLALSSVHQQRILALQVLSFIMKRSVHGEYKGLIEGHPLSVLVESEVLTMFRYTLDESPESLQSVAVYGFHCLLVLPAQDYLLSWHHGSSIGHLLPYLTPLQRERDEEEESDHVIKDDIVKGLLKMTLLPRLRYILEVCQPQEGVAVKILEILIRLSQHSLQAADEILHCPRLITFIFNSFLPLNPTNGGDCFYSKPHPLAMKLMASLCRASRHIAKELISTHNLLPVILNHVLIFQDHTPSLTSEACRVWSVLLGYSLTVETVSDTLPSLLNIFSSPSPFLLPSDKLERVSSLYLLLSSALAAIVTIPSYTSPSFHVVDHALKALTRVLRECRDSDKDISLDIVQYITSLLSIPCVYYRAFSQRPELRVNPVSLLEEVESVVNGVMKLLLSSKLYSFITKTLLSLLEVLDSLSSFSYLPSFISSSLSSKPAIYNKDAMEEKDYPLLSHNQSVALVFSDLLSLSQQLCLSLCQLHHGVAIDICQLVLSSGSHWIQLMEKFVNTSITNSSLPYLHVYQCLFSTVKLLLLEPSALDASQLCLLHCVSLSLLTYSPLGYESHAIDLLKSIIFNPFLYIDGQKDVTPPLSNTISFESISPHLPSVNDMYVKLCSSFISEKDVVRSSCVMNGDMSQVDTQCLPSQTKFVLPSNWLHLPLLAKIDENQTDGDLVTSHVSHCLYFILFLETQRSQFMQQTSCSERLIRVMSTFLISSDIFFEPVISSSLSSLFSCYSNPNFFRFVDFSLSPSFQEFHTNLLDHFAAVSYGHQTFSTFLLFPLQQRHSVSFRKDFWIDHTHILRLITLAPSQFSLPLDSFLYPIEWESDLLNQYLRVLASEVINEQRNPLLFGIAAHHVSSAINSTKERSQDYTGSSETCKRLASAVERLPNQLLRRRLLSL
ncbi:PREDICTED: RNA polymerase II-associated protein 1-like isoform X2 [Amphimedon queenslandica]|uniref:RNA polymerase II-associated protein 1 C-terminal domain-containing protein n=1 Tax=Amphimedon queenslandica TaxID=400682 RepID=A0AAN0ILS3_AMPQE|nr:PREDICTED: RNA polymerase II-associated protein 1-like isoform X2 [Amphimedon queenslandica]|eukprot:XP_011403848.2 PREDICTED: RNA polymerase II-associated protein 1-like isoform X2 [Amphimedon queenslandica]